MVPARTDVRRRPRQAGPVVAGPPVAMTGSPQRLSGPAGGRSLDGSVRASPAEPVSAARHSRASPPTGPQRPPVVLSQRLMALAGWRSREHADGPRAQWGCLSGSPQASRRQRRPCCTISFGEAFACHRALPSDRSSPPPARRRHAQVVCRQHRALGGTEWIAVAASECYAEVARVPRSRGAAGPVRKAVRPMSGRPSGPNG